MKYPIRIMIGAALLTGSVATTMAQEIPNEGPVPTTVLINVDSKHNEPLNPALLKLEVNRHESPITARCV